MDIKGIIQLTLALISQRCMAWRWTAMQIQNGRPDDMLRDGPTMALF